MKKKNSFFFSRFFLKRLDLVSRVCFKWPALALWCNNLLAKYHVSHVVHLKRITRTSSEKRSVVFLGHSYYCFFHLAHALRKRGWDALSIGSQRPSKYDFLCHNWDLDLYSPDAKVFRSNVQAFLSDLPNRFRMVHIYGRRNFWPSLGYNAIPLDLLYLKKQGVKIGFTPSGCLEAATQSTIYRTTGGLCNKCVWQDNPRVCSDHLNHFFLQKIHRYFDFIAYENDGNMGVERDLKGFTEPLVYGLDPDFWSPDIAVPESRRIARKSPDHLLVLTGFALKKDRSTPTKDIKGSYAIQKALNKLVSEGYPIQPIFVTDVPSIDMRYLQVQADILVDQVNYGRYGAFAREGMMLGKPVLCNINYFKPEECFSLNEHPLIQATEETVYDVLKKVIFMSKEQRDEIGQRSRAYMMKWHSADACAERFEKVYDRLMQGLPPYSRELFL